MRDFAVLRRAAGFDAELSNTSPPPGDHPAKKTPCPGPVDGQQGQTEREHPVAQNRKKPEQSTDHQQYAGGFPDPVIGVVFQAMEVTMYERSQGTLRPAWWS